MALLLATLVLTLAAPPQATPAPEAPPQRPNILILVADDVGTDKIGACGEHPAAPRTPCLDELAAAGLRFQNAYATPLCSASRAALLTGRYGRRNGVGGALRWNGAWELPLAELTLAELLRQDGLGYATAAVGKWHLSGPDTPSHARHPNLQGFEHYAGALHNLYVDELETPSSYFQYDKVVDGETKRVDEYATSATTDDALAALERMAEPWFLYVAYNAAHAPLHAPPGSELQKDASPTALYDAMVEALDHEIGRLLAGISAEERARTIILFVGDNGTDPRAIVPPRKPEQGKPTLWEGGINVPFFVAGPCVARPGAVTDALVHVVDVLPTLARLLGVEPAPTGKTLDGIAFEDVLAESSSPGRRRFVYSERFEPAGAGPYRLDGRVVRDERCKLIDLDGQRSFHDLRGRFDDGPGLLQSELADDQRASLAALEAELERIRREVRFEY